MKLHTLYETPLTPRTAYFQAHDIYKQRTPQLEPIILQSPYWSYMYAHRVLKHRWLEAEPLILTNRNIAKNYIRDVIKGRWPESEPLTPEELSQLQKRRPNHNIINPQYINGELTYRLEQKTNINNHHSKNTL